MRNSSCLLIVCLCSLSLSSLALGAESAAALRWTAPADWKSAGQQLMPRVATYKISAVTGDKAGAECVVYFFGAGQGGTVDANLDRWKGQFQGPAGKPAPAQVATRKSRGLSITTIDTAGEYSGMGGPIAAAPAVPGYRLLGAIVEGPAGNIFIKFTGPAKTIAANQKKFELLLTSFQPDK